MSAQRAAARFAAKVRDEVTITYTHWEQGATVDTVTAGRKGRSTPVSVTVNGNAFEPDIASMRVQQFAGFQAGDMILDVPANAVSFLDDASNEGFRFQIYGVTYTSKRMPDQSTQSYETGAGSKVLRRLLLSRARNQ